MGEVANETMGDTEFDSFFEDGEAPAANPVDENPFGDAPVEAGSGFGDGDVFGDGGGDVFGDAGCDNAAPAADTEAFDFGDAAPCVADESMGGGMDMSMGGGMDMSMGDMGGMDMSNAFVTTANLCDSGPLAEWRAQNRAEMEERAAASKAQLDDILAQAQSDRDAFYAQRQATLDATKKANREAEASLKESRASDAVKENLWESVTELVDLQAKQDGSDISRMRQTMLAMKNETA